MQKECNKRNASSAHTVTAQGKAYTPRVSLIFNAMPQPQAVQFVYNNGHLN